MGFNAPGYVLMGWHIGSMPIITSAALENTISATTNFYTVGGSYTITGDTTLYAVWAIDKNKDEIPDYNASIVRPVWDGKTRIGLPVDDDDDGTSLRSLPAWNNNYNLKAFYDSVYHVGCMYNVDPDNGLYESKIKMDGRSCFSKVDSVRAAKNLNLVIEYDGVLADACMIGGPDQKPLSVIKFKQGTMVDSLINNYPLMFESIKKDGQGILKMYFVNPANKDSLAEIMTDFYYEPFSSTKNTELKSWGKPFMNDNVASDTLIIKFNIYNKPEFKSEVIGQSVDLQGNIDLKHLSGTPLKYMMRCINGFRWRAADSPLSNAEKGEIGDGISSLRELDQTIGYQMFCKEFYFTDEFDPITISDPQNDYHADYLLFVNEKLDKYIFDFWENINSTDRVNAKSMYDLFMAPSTLDTFNLNATDIGIGLSFVGGSLTSSAPYNYYNSIDAADTAEVWAIADWETYALQKAEAIDPLADPCREMFCLAFETKVYPTIMQEVSIPQVSGATIVDIGYGTHYVASQGNFTFSVKYASEPPMMVTTNRIVDGVKEELVGTLNAAGEYEYVIRRVTQNIVLTFSAGSVDNASVMGGTAVWSHDNTIYIRVAQADAASIYSIAGRLVKRIELPAGDTPVPVERGVYIVTLKDGLRYKVVVK